MDETEITVRPIRVEDAGQVLTLQRAAFVTEALIYDDPAMGPLTQTLEALEFELHDNLGYVAEIRGRVVGAARAVTSDSLLLVGRIAVAPDQQGRESARSCSRRWKSAASSADVGRRSCSPAR